MFAIEFFGNLHINGGDVGPAFAGSWAGGAVAAKFEIGAGLGAGGNFHGNDTVDGTDIDLRAESSVDHGNDFF